ncbi:hypothetical protein MMC30_001036 [Trapelia coarctata]|nr:hypothetical protein [Trapelia coarctata]
MVLWLGMLFTTIGIAASDFFCINLSTISNVLGMSESMAGVTFLAFGNGSPDVFSTFAAMSTNSGSLAVGELIGAAGFITAVVAGSMALVRPFRVARKSFMRDIGFFIVAATFSMVFLGDGYLQLWECIVMVAFYIFYVITVVVWHWYLGRLRRKKERESLARGTFLVPEDEVSEARDEPDEHTSLVQRGRGISRGSTMDDFLALERAGSPYAADGGEEDDDDTRDRWMAEISRNMRVGRPALGDRQHTTNPIRPSLVGALEFRAVLSSLNKSRNQQNILINLRRYSDDPTFTLAQQQQNATSTSNSSQPHLEDVHQVIADDLVIQALSDRSNRTRAVSANDAASLQLNPNNSQNSSGPYIDILGLTPPGSASLQIPAFFSRAPVTDPSSPSLLVSSPDGLVSDAAAWPLGPQIVVPDHLAPPTNGFPRLSGQEQHTLGRPHERTNLPTLSPRSGISRQWSKTSMLSTSSSPAVPFPPYYDDPDFFSRTSPAPSIRLPPPSLSSETVFNHSGVELFFQKRFRWWPYSVLPPPEFVASTLFPTLYTWSDKSIAEKCLGIIAAPSILLLAVTLPVVETGNDEVHQPVLQDAAPQAPDRNPSQSYANAITASPSSSPGIQARDSTSNVRNQPSSQFEHVQDRGMNPGDETAFGVEGPKVRENVQVQNDEPPPERSNTGFTTAQAVDPSDHRSVHATKELPSSPKDWNRWLVCTQVFTAPLFIVLLIWANIDETRSGRNLLLPTLYSLLGSLIVLAFVLLTTSSEKPPRFRIMLCFVGFVVSIAWISTIANEVVGVLKAIGVILGISDAILGLTIFAVGNSLGDLVADITVARLGYPVMALSACFGGPMLNILLGIGLSGLYMTISDGNKKHSRHPHRPIKYKPYQVEVGGTLMISAISLLVTLVGLLIVVPLNKWTLDRRIGWGLITLWCLSTVGNVVVEVSGWGGDMA